MTQLSEFQRERVQAVLAASPLVPVIAINELEDAVPLCQALVDGGINVLEITLRTEHGVNAIKAVREAIPDAWLAPVRSLAWPSIARSRRRSAVCDHPGVTEAILEFGVTSEAPLLPGISTVSELMMGYALGYREFKFFPAEVSGGVPALKAFSGPFSDVTFCPTGGIRRDTAKDYLALKNVKAVGGSWLTPADVVAAKDWAQITQIARDSLADL